MLAYSLVGVPEGQFQVQSIVSLKNPLKLLEIRFAIFGWYHIISYTISKF